MCTVTFVPAGNNIIITSNRDEKKLRKKAIHPSLYQVNGHRLIMPKDTEKGGTWIAMKENGDAAVLLNGAFIPHLSQPPYRESRGTIFVKIIAMGKPSVFFRSADLSGIEPFTFILWENRRLIEYRWDGCEKFHRLLDEKQAYIWSSCTLYDSTECRAREDWFRQFQQNKPRLTQQDIIHFHRFYQKENGNGGLILNSNDHYQTVSITSLFITPDRGSLKYLDLTDQKTSEVKIVLTQANEI